jgi:ABC-type branched-subunit amino acid transport system ATPase component
VTAVIELDRLTKRYGAARGIEDVSMTVEGGEVFGFLGPIGAGKTTSTARSASSRAATGRRSAWSRRPSTTRSCSCSTSRPAVSTP